MGIADDREMLEAAKRECVRLERELAKVPGQLRRAWQEGWDAGFDDNAPSSRLPGHRNPYYPREEQP